MPRSSYSSLQNCWGSKENLDLSSIGSFLNFGSSFKLQCPAGTLCTGTSTMGYPCPAGSYCPAANPPNKSILCPAGTYCPIGSATPVPLPSGWYSQNSGLVKYTDATQCKSGDYCPPLSWPTTETYDFSSSMSQQVWTSLYKNKSGVNPSGLITIADSINKPVKIKVLTNYLKINGVKLTDPQHPFFFLAINYYIGPFSSKSSAQSFLNISSLTKTNINYNLIVVQDLDSKKWFIVNHFYPLLQYSSGSVFFTDPYNLTNGNVTGAPLNDASVYSGRLDTVPFTQMPYKFFYTNSTAIVNEFQEPDLKYRYEL